MASSMLSSATMVASPAQATMVAPFTGLKSSAAFPVTRKANNDITSITSNGGRVNCMQVWPPIGKKKFETLSYLPDLTDVELGKEVDYLLRNKWIPCVEFELEHGFVYREHGNSPGYYDGRYWTMWKLPLFGCTDSAQVLKEVQECKKEYPEHKPSKSSGSGARESKMKGGTTSSMRTSWTMSVRRSGYKAVVDGVGGRRRREDDMVEIRKAKREESLLKKRREALPHSPSDVSLDQKLISRVWSDKRDLLIEATTQIRTLLCGEMFSVRVEEVIQAGLVPRFVEFLTWDDFPQLQFEAAWALTNIASGTSENTEVVIDHGAVAILVRLLSSPYDGVREQVVWALGNISGDSPRCRDIVLVHGALPSLLLQLNHGAKLSMLVNAAWTLSNLCRGKPEPPFDQVRAALPSLAQLIRLDDKEVLAYACWALVYLSDGSNEKVQAVIEANVCARLIGLSVHRSPSVLTPALRTIGNIVTGNDSQTQHIIDLQALPCLLNLLRGSYNKTIRKEACWAVSNITAGCRSQIQAVFDADICPALVSLLQNSELDVKNEAAWAICNAIAGGSYKQILFLVKQNCIKPLCDLLTSSDSQLVMVCLEALEKMLKVGEVCNTRQAEGIYQCPQINVNPHAQLIEEAEGLEKIESLQSHENNDIYETAVKILETYWMEEEEEGQQDMLYFPLENFSNMPTPSGTTLSEMYCRP